MTALRLILADQLSESMPSLQGLDTAQDTVMLCEVMEEARYVPHHPKKIAFLFSAMRHFAGFSLGGGVLGVLRTASHWFAQRGFLCNVTWLFAPKPSGKSHCFLMIFIFEGSKPFRTPT